MVGGPTGSVGQHRDERAGRGCDGGDVDQDTDDTGVVRARCRCRRPLMRVGATDRPCSDSPGDERRGLPVVDAGVDDAHGVTTTSRGHARRCGLVERGAGVVGAGGEPAEHVDQDVGGAGGGAVHRDRELAVGAGPHDGQVGDGLADAEVEHRGGGGRTRRVGAELAGATVGVVDGDAGHDREHVGCRRRQPPLPSNGRSNVGSPVGPRPST